MAALLVIDDSEEVRNMARSILGGEHDVSVMDSWVSAAEFIAQHDFDLILLDIQMPGLQGDKVAEILLKHITHKAVNIVLFSTIDEADLRRKAKEVGALGYIPKTFDGNFLRARVRKFVEKIEQDRKEKS